MISFDEEEGNLSSSTPSSSGSITSDSNSSQDVNIPETKLTEISKSQHDDKTPEQVRTKESNLERSLSIENSGTRDRFVKTLEGPLMPMQVNIGELTPISVEMSSESPDLSDTTLEIPSDISAVLDAVEKKNQEKLSKLQDNIDALSAENSCLKEQLKKYIGAVQMLNDDGVQQNFQDIENVPQPDYKHEAKVFERKLVEVFF